VPAPRRGSPPRWLEKRGRSSQPAALVAPSGLCRKRPGAGNFTAPAGAAPGSSRPRSRRSAVQLEQCVGGVLEQLLPHALRKRCEQLALLSLRVHPAPLLSARRRGDKALHTRL
jgi:hypothetical protein